MQFGKRKHISQNNEVNTHEVEVQNITRVKNKIQRHAEDLAFRNSSFIFAEYEGCNLLFNPKLGEKHAVGDSFGLDPAV